ncbi:hypothetical protein PBRA_001749 [Plasmodiophora brassicae]|uniref:EF-hand domain-containing protein n=1 Tax=Plasmodiophora brassicae TaxID=37360 RepID=A0A0G4J095_PLABS|nr:hypothetical protein PBRA_001749 [Plasmodiophora brassicae]
MRSWPSRPPGPVFHPSAAPFRGPWNANQARVRIDRLRRTRDDQVVSGMVGGDHVATDEEMLELKTIFELVDRDRCGTIDRSELKLLMSILRIPMTEEEIEALIKQMDKNQDSVIQFDEYLRQSSFGSDVLMRGNRFAAASTKKVDTMDPDQVLRAFRSFSKTPDKGRINVADLEEALTTDGSPPLSQEQAQSIIQQLDVNKNGDFKYAEYVRTLIHRRPPPHVSLRSLHRRQSSRLSLNAPPSLTRWTSMAQ